MTDDTAPQPPRFVRGNDHLDWLLSDPQLAADVAKRLGVGLAAVSRIESRGDMLLSTLYDYLTAAGADAASIVVTVHGRRIELDLGSLRARPETAAH